MNELSRSLSSNSRGTFFRVSSLDDIYEAVCLFIKIAAVARTESHTGAIPNESVMLMVSTCLDSLLDVRSSEPCWRRTGENVRSYEMQYYTYYGSGRVGRITGSEFQCAETPATMIQTFRKIALVILNRFSVSGAAVEKVQET